MFLQSKYLAAATTAALITFSGTALSDDTYVYEAEPFDFNVSEVGGEGWEHWDWYPAETGYDEVWASRGRYDYGVDTIAGISHATGDRSFIFSASGPYECFTGIRFDTSGPITVVSPTTGETSIFSTITLGEINYSRFQPDMEIRLDYDQSWLDFGSGGRVSLREMGFVNGGNYNGAIIPGGVYGYGAEDFYMPNLVQGNVEGHFQSIHLVYGYYAYGSSPAIPEPGTYAMLLAGLGIVGAAVRRRRGKPD